MQNLEALDMYKSNFVKQLMEAYDPFLEAVGKHKTDFTDEQSAKLAITLHNTNKALSHMNEATQPVDVQNFKQQALALVSAVMPNLIAEDIVSVQPIALKVAQVFFLKYVYGSNKGAVKQGDLLFDRYGKPQKGYDEYNYTSEVVEGEEIGTGDNSTTDFNANLSYTTVRTIDAIDGVPVTVDAKGKITGENLTSGTIDFESGALTLKFKSAPTDGHAIEVDYQYDLETVQSTIPEINLQLSETTIKARPRKLKTLWSFDASYDLQQQQGIDISESMMEAAVNSIKSEIDAEIMADLWRQALLTSTWNKRWDATSGLSKREYNMTFIDEIMEAGNAMFEATRRVQPNFIIVGRWGADALDSVGAPRFVSASMAGGTGAYFAGVLDGKIKVYKNPYYKKEQYLIGYRGETLVDAGYVYSPYLPIMATNLLMMEDFTGRRGYATSYGKKMLQPSLYIKGTIVDQAHNG